MTSELPRLLVAGVGPLPPERPGRLFAPGLRIWGMARELARAGHPVRLAVADFEAAAEGALRLYDLEPDRPAEPLPEPLPAEEGSLAERLAEAADGWNAAAAIASSDVMTRALADSGLELPMWFDFFGDPMAERQMLARRAGSDDGLGDQWAMIAPALARADRVSGCSTDQCGALLGQLGAVGRLGRLTAGQRLVSRLAPWIEPIAPSPGDEALLRGRVMPEDGVLAIQTGGFNTWLDVETLFEALEIAMNSLPQFHFAATGGAIPGHYAKGFEWFAAQVAASPHRDRYHLLGWRPLGEVPRLVGEANLAINLDLPCVEGILGTRNRLMDWLLGEAAVVTTPGCELALELGDEGVATMVPHGDAKAAARAILAIAADPESHRRRARRGAQYLKQAHDAAHCLRGLLEWAGAPQSAPDLQAWRSGQADPPLLWRQARTAGGPVPQAPLPDQRAALLEQKLARMEGSRWVRLALWMRGRDDLNGPPGPA